MGRSLEGDVLLIVDGEQVWIVDILPHLSASRHRRGIPITG